MTTTIEKLFPGFTSTQKRDLLYYTIGIICYKLGLESALGSLKTMITERFNADPSTSANAFATIGLLDGLNTLCQALGAIALAISFFAACCLVFLIMEPIAGGRVIQYVTKNGKRVPDTATYGSWTPWILFPLGFVIFISYGVIELIRRVIPRDIVGGDVNKLKKMDSHVAGTGGAFFSAYMIQTLGHVYALCTVPPLFLGAAWCWYQLSSPERKVSNVEGPKRSVLGSVGHYIGVYFSSIITGARIIFSSRRFIWLLPGYTVGLVFHRYLEGGINPNFSKIVLGDSSYSQIMNGGSNFGEFLGAVAVFFLATQIKTPIPWVRLDAVTLNLVWLLPVLGATLLVDGKVSVNAFAWIMAGIYVFVSAGWSAGDVSLAAYVQSQLDHHDVESAEAQEVSPLGAVMAFLYSSNIAIYFCLSFGLGKYLDIYSNRLKSIKDDKNLAFLTGIEPFYMIGGVLFTVGCVVILLGTFIPQGALAINPEVLAGDKESDEKQDLEAMAAK
ncbi:hypothetical protein BDR26DRAFT_873758 [Obelidium mucronatum]|nr:hypothetical protein BDR26DRAFT_873758 [Obelidium mucronatum]